MRYGQADVRNFLRTSEGQRMFRYSMTSVISLVVSVVVLALLNGVVGCSAWVSSSLATAVATIPSFELNRKWAWGREGKSHLMREVVPFWVLSFIGWGFSTLCSDLAEGWTHRHHVAHTEATAVITVVYVAAFGVLWVGKYIIFNKVLFASHPQDLTEALDGRTGVPT